MDGCTAGLVVAFAVAGRDGGALICCINAAKRLSSYSFLDFGSRKTLSAEQAVNPRV